MRAVDVEPDRDRGAYRALFVSDIHMSNKLPHAQPSENGRTDRLDDQLKLWERIHARARKEDVKATFVLGDLFDKSLVDAVTLTHTVEAVQASPVPIFILPGNHDAVNTSGGRFTVEAFGKMGGHVHYLDGTMYQVSDWLRFWPVPFMPSGPTLDWIRDIRERKAGMKRARDVLLLHTSIVGCTHLGWVCDDGLPAEEVCKGFDTVLSGHFHTHQRFGTDAIYLGAPMHHRYDDAGRDAFFWTVRWKSNLTAPPEMWRHKGGCPRFHVWDWRDGDPEKFKKVRPGDYLRVQVRATHAEWTAVQGEVKELVEGLIEDGVRVEIKHKPIYHHEVRLKRTSADDAPSIDAMVAEYPDSGDVDAEGLDLKMLKRIGRRAMEEARMIRAD